MFYGSPRAGDGHSMSTCGINPNETSPCGLQYDVARLRRDRVFNDTFDGWWRAQRMHASVQFSNKDIRPTKATKIELEYN